MTGITDLSEEDLKDALEKIKALAKDQKQTMPVRKNSFRYADNATIGWLGDMPGAVYNHFMDSDN